MSCVQLPGVLSSCQRRVDHRRLEELVALAVVTGALVLGPPVTRLLGADQVHTAAGCLAAAAASPPPRLASTPVVAAVAVEVVPAAVVAPHPLATVGKKII